jgi:hypothetical protein
MMRKMITYVLATAAMFPNLALGQDIGEVMTGTMPVYSRIVAFPVPATFVSAYENEDDGSYILEFTPEGETVDDWSQLITITGSKDTTAASGTPLNFGSILGNQFKSACPDSFRAWDEGEMDVKGAEAAHLFRFACGDLGGYSESAAILVAFSGADVYTFQWAERGDATAKPESDTAIWQPRAQNLVQLRLCPPVEGEEPPYSSCTQ